MSGAMDNAYASLLGFWHAADQLLASRGLPALDVEEATRLFRAAQDEEARVTFQHLRRAFCTACPLAMAVSYFAAADRAELAGDLERADTLRFTALSLTQAELKIRQS